MTAAKRRLILLLLAAANLPVYAAAVAIAVSFDGPISGCASSIYGAQWLLVPIWAVLGTSRWPVRLAGLVLDCCFFVLSMWLAVLVQLMQIDPTYSSLSNLFGPDSMGIGFQVAEIVVVDFVLVAAALLAMRLAGLRLVSFSRPVAARGSAWPQFSLKRLLALTGAVAMALSLGNAFRSSKIESPGVAVMLLSLIVAAESAVVTCLAVWSVLSPAPPAARIALANVLAALTALLPAYFFRVQAVDLPHDVLDGFIKAIWLSGSLLVVRACGYRAIWPADWVWAAGLADEL